MCLVPFCHLQGYMEYALNCFLSVSESKGIKASILILKYVLESLLANRLDFSHLDIIDCHIVGIIIKQSAILILKRKITKENNKETNI